jgi:hypothetical protein
VHAFPLGNGASAIGPARTALKDHVLAGYLDALRTCMSVGVAPVDRE